MDVPRDQKLTFAALLALVVGSMVGGGIYSLPRTFANDTGPLGAVIAWLVAGAGMFMLARVFQTLAERKPGLDAGVFAYAKAGFGDYPGFLSAFGYWIAACIANVSYWVLIKATLGAAIPAFGDGSTFPAIVSSSVGIWLFHFLILRGVQQAAKLNRVVTFAKIIPILVFLAILGVSFQPDLFLANFSGGDSQNGLFDQIRATMLVTVFVFIGVEGASVYSRYAKKRSDVGAATILGFLGVTLLMVLVTLLPYGVMPRSDIAGLRQPSVAGVLSAVVGSWGTVFISIGLIVSVLGAYLAWSLICAEILFSTARTRDMPETFARMNGRGVPANALWLTNAVIQVLLISTYFSDDALDLMLKLTSAVALVPYFFVAAYGFILTRRGETYEGDPGARKRDGVISGIALVYTLFMIFSGGIKFILLAALLYAMGTLLFIWTRKENGQRIFIMSDWVILAFLLAGAVAGLAGLMTGWIPF